MSDELVVSGGGSFAVATEEMLSNADHLLRAAELTRHIAGAVQMVDTRLTMGQLEAWGVPTAAALAEDDLDRAYAALHTLVLRAERLNTLVRLAATSYGAGEALVEGVTRQLAAEAATVLGYLFPTVFAATVVVLSPLLPALVALGLAAYLLGRNNPDLIDTAAMSANLTKLISDPTFVWALRHGVMTVDEFVAGAMGLPPSAVSALSAAGVIGLATSAGLVQRAGGLAGILKETPVTLVSKTLPHEVTAAKTFSDRASRIPQPTPDHPWQIRVEQYSRNGELDHAEVYLSGTVDFAVSGTTNPSDMTSNLSNAAGQRSGFNAAVISALKDAGVTSHTPITFTGYSGGASTAMHLAESGEYNTVGVFTLGGNTGQILISPDIPAIIVEHTDDLVVASGGLQDNSHALVVERQAMAGHELPAGVAVPAHQFKEYAETARLMDQSDSPQLREANDRLMQHGRGAQTATVTQYAYERVRPAQD
ncbi:MAG: hypothetical protein ACOH1K_01275 [Rhodoglobus sp.]